MLSKLRRPKARWTEIVRIAADAVHLSPSSCLRRVRALEDAGIIKGYVALLDPAKIGKGFTAYARVWLTAQDLETVQCIVDALSQLRRSSSVTSWLVSVTLCCAWSRLI
ncbi:Lrp/AsnC family transcriptional regulator [Corynebacterium stationis]|uniref:Lrp/AsnC family transcriptional regulator n=1 Tax=Corynebacterium stationis TaxID=1705 RepID=UPI003C6CBE8E